MPKHYFAEEDIVGWHSLFFGNENAPFLLIVVVRTVVMFLIVLAALRMLGKRSVKQLSVFELLVILTLGSAAGDPMLYNEVGLLESIIVFIAIVSLYRLTTWVAARSQTFTRFIKGMPVYLIVDGKFCAEAFRHQPIAFDEFFSELRVQGVSQLGQVRTLILETSGELSLFFFPDNEVLYGLSILPATNDKEIRNIAENDFYAFIAQGEKMRSEPGEHNGKSCGSDGWAKASNERRIT